MPRWRRWFVLVLMAVVSAATIVSCASNGAESGASGAADAGGETSVESRAGSAIVERAARLAAGDRRLSARLAPGAAAARWVRQGDGFVAVAGAAASPGGVVSARLGADGALSVHAGSAATGVPALALAPASARAGAATLDQGRVALADVATSTDLVAVADDRAIEWMYVLRDERAPTELSLGVTLGAGIQALRPDGTGALVAVDAHGDAVLRITRPFALDAHGTRREASLEHRDGALRIALDARGLAYPVLLDPAIETAVWEQRTSPPGARYGAAAAFDEARSRMVLFGGLRTSRLGDTWEWDGTWWTLRTTTGPAARAFARMTYDPKRKVTVLFGGEATNGSALGDTWEWDGVKWTEACTDPSCASAAPPPRSRHAMAWDPVHQQAILFGGEGGSGPLGDMWGWDGSVWSKLCTASPCKDAVPAPRERAALAWDDEAGKAVLFGGDDGAAYFGDTWTWDGATWTHRADAGPTASSGVLSVYDGGRRRVTMFGGIVGEFTASWLALDQMWSWDDGAAAWTPVAPGTHPVARSAAAGAYDGARGQVVLFGGTTDTGAVGDTWGWDGSAWLKSSAYPDARNGFGLAYDSTRGKAMLFSGEFGWGAVDDLWAYGGTRWTRVWSSTDDCQTNPAIPCPRARFAMAYDDARDRIVVYGGDAAGSMVNDLWEFDGAAWQRRCADAPCSMPPSRRYPSSGTFDPVRKRFMVFGGFVYPADVNETWEWDGTSWSAMCTSSPCNDNVPAPRERATTTFDRAGKRVVLFGGVSGIEHFDDLWAWDGTAWTELCTSAACKATAPTGYTQGTLTFDSVRERLVLFGTDGTTWEFHDDAWTNVSSTGPGFRSDARIVFDDARQRVVLWGGGGNDDTWEYHTRGGGCDVGVSCATGFCVDGVCCESISCGPCQACNLASSPGVCASVADADDLDSCYGSRTCDALGRCRKKHGEVCGQASDCASGFCADGYCCDTSCDGGCDVCDATKGTCTPRAKGATGSSPSCGGFLCDGVSGGCPGSCAVDGDCASGWFCAAGGVCQPRRSQGLPCNTASGGDCKAPGCRECGDGFTCKDGYCCNGPCDGTCETCAATAGECTAVKGGDDADTCTGASTCSAAGSCLADLGQPCGAGSACASGFCADGVCCNVACGGGCDTCNAAGVCTVVGQGSAGANPSCGAYVCNGSSASCPSSCGNDADCASDHYCAANGTCKPRKAQAAACDAAAGADCKSAGCRVCESDHCIDGFCCDAACGGACDACNGAALGWPAATNGTCTVAPSGFAGTPTCSVYACDGVSASCGTTCADDDQCASGYYCSSAGMCLPQRTQAQSCNPATDCKLPAGCRECQTGFCSDGVCCNAACSGACDTCDAAGSVGFCTVLGAGSIGSPPCTPYSCNGTSAACDTSCTSDAGCATGAYCGNDGQCHAKLGVAAACGSAHECSSGFCVEGVCCNTACDGVCQACTAANKASGADGTCDKAKAGVDPHDDCADDRIGNPTSCALDGLCDGAGACRYYAKGTTCGQTSCNANVQTGHACDGKGTCLDDAAQDCGEYACITGACKTSCNKDGDCSASAYCDVATSACVPKAANGAACTKASTCLSGFCADGFCCNAACDGQCEACDVGTATGTCSPVTGDPHGSRKPCAGATDATPDGICAARTCDGSDGASCQGHVGADVPCRQQACAAGIQSFSATCNGKGACNDAADVLQTKPCEPYACGATACKDKCTVDADCTPGYRCDAASGKCLTGAECDGDHTIKAPGQAPTDCRPYRCQSGGTCKASCASVDDCVEGFVCDANGQCATPTVVESSPADGSGCGCHAVGGGAGEVRWLGLAVLAIASRARRRQRRRARRGGSAGSDAIRASASRRSLPHTRSHSSKIIGSTMK